MYLLGPHTRSHNSGIALPHTSESSRAFGFCCLMCVDCPCGIRSREVLSDPLFRPVLLKRSPLLRSPFPFSLPPPSKAYCQGARDLLIGVGGSATVDAGLGALQALGLEITLKQVAPSVRTMCLFSPQSWRRSCQDSSTTDPMPRLCPLSPP